MTAPELRHFWTGVLIFVVSLCLGLMEAPLIARLTLGILALHFAWRACTNMTGSGHPIGLYILVSSLYVFGGLAEVALFGNRLNLDTVLMGDLADMGVAFLLCVSAGYLLFREKPFAVKSSLGADKGLVSVGLFVCMMLFLVCEFTTFLNYGTVIGSISRADIYSSENTMLTVMRGILATSFGIVAALLVTYEQSSGTRLLFARIQLFAMLGAYVLTDLLILGDRRLPLMAILGVAVLMLPKRFTWPQLSTAVALGVALFLYGYVRNTPPSEWLRVLTSGEILVVFSPASNEFGGMAIIGGAIGNFDFPISGFPHYSEAFFQILPRSIVASRPLSPTEWFIQSYYPQLAASGASYAFNQVIEARINAGIFGIVTAGLFTGAVIAMLCRIRYEGIPIGVPLCINIFCFSMRMDFASILRTGIISIMGTILVLVAVTVLRPQSSRSSVTHRVS